jgi:hypothetical protein
VKSAVGSFVDPEARPNVRALPFALCAALALALSPQAHAAPAQPTRTLDDYRHFRALSIDLLGRMPTRTELELFEKSEFDLDAWIDKHLEGSPFVDRLTRVYMDLLRLEVGPAFQFRPAASTLRRVTVEGPDGKPTYVFFRLNQRRAREETDGEFCLTEAESGLKIPANNQPAQGMAKAVSQAALDANTVLVRPWWLYRDYRSATPVLRYGDTWSTADPGYRPVDELLVEADDKTPTLAVRVCKEEASVKETGKIYTTGRKTVPGPPPFGRLRPLPLDDAYAKAHKGDPLSCTSASSLSMSTECGCGVGLERCMPADGFKKNAGAFVIPSRVPLGIDLPMDSFAQSPSEWHKFWWSQEALKFMARVFGADRDFREMLTAKYTYVNGPLAHFYRSSSLAATGKAKAFGLVDDGEPLFDPARVPSDLLPHDVSLWQEVADRGPRASGIVTMPVFLTKYASRRARGAALYTTFLCKSFSAEAVMLMPSTEPNLMIRPGCNTCHATLEPLAAYFSRVVETDMSFLPAAQFPLSNPLCKKGPKGQFPGFCRDFYDPAFGDEKAGLLRGAYASPEHAEAGPAGAAAEVIASPAFASCAVERVTASFLGRPINADDAVLLKSLESAFVSGGYKMKALVRALVRSSTYRAGNNLSSASWRGGK